MRENRLSGLEGGGELRLSPYPYRAVTDLDAILDHTIIPASARGAGFDRRR